MGDGAGAAVVRGRMKRREDKSAESVANISAVEGKETQKKGRKRVLEAREARLSHDPLSMKIVSDRPMKSI